MKLYIVTAEPYHDNSKILGAYRSTLRAHLAAKKAKMEYAKERYPIYEDVEVTEVEVEDMEIDLAP